MKERKIPLLNLSFFLLLLFVIPEMDIVTERPFVTAATVAAAAIALVRPWNEQENEGRESDDAISQSFSLDP